LYAVTHARFELRRVLLGSCRCRKLRSRMTL